MVPLKFGRVTKEEIAALITGKAREGRHLDYKRELPTSGNDAKKEFLADVTSFANSGGGVIVFGVAEEKDAAGKNTGVPEEIVGLGGANLDAEQLRLEQWLRTGVEPRLPAHRFHVSEIEPGKQVLVLVIKQSWMGPHMVATADSRFYARTSAGKYPLDVAEIRSAFLEGEELPARIRRFRDQRLAAIASGETPVELGPGSRIVLHMIPLVAMGRGHLADLQAWAKLAPPALGGALRGGQFNADGHVGVDGGQKGTTGYVQFLRSGSVEAVAANNHEVDGLPVMNVWAWEVEIVDTFQRYTKAFQEIGLEGPVAVLLSLVGVRGHGLCPSPLRGRGGRPVVTRDVVTLPDIVVEDPSVEPSTTLRPIFDALWQTFGLPRSLAYGDDGTWTRDFRW